MKKRQKEKKSANSLSGAVRNYYLLINTLLLLVCGIGMMWASASTLIRKAEEKSAIVNQQAGYSIEQTLNDIVGQMVNFSSYKTLIGQLNRTEYTAQEQLNLERELKTALKTTDLFNSVVQEIMVVMDQGFFFSNSLKTKSTNSYDYCSQTWYQDAKKVSDNNYVKILGLHKIDFYSYSYADRAQDSTFSVSFALSNAKGEIIGALIYNFDLNSMMKLLKNFNSEEKGTVLLLDEDGMVVSSSDGEHLGEVMEFAALSSSFAEDGKSAAFQTEVNGQNCLVGMQKISLGMTVVSIVPRSEIWKQTGSLIVVLIGMIVCGVIINIWIAFYVTHTIRKPVAKLTSNVQQVDSEHLFLPVEAYDYQELNQIAEKFNELLGKLNTLITKDYKSQILLNKFRLYSLQSQINPHFLMNTLQQLQTEIVYGNVEESNDIIVSLSKMLRYSLYHYESTVPITMEIQYIQSYLNLFMQKYEGELRAEYEIDERAGGYYMPKMILQPVVENCITHAFDENPKDALIQIKVKYQDDGFYFTIEDNGDGMTETQLEQVREDLMNPEIDQCKIGIRNIHQRIRLNYGESYGVTLTSKKGIGTKFKIRIPLLNGTEAEKKEEENETSDCG